VPTPSTRRPEHLLLIAWTVALALLVGWTYRSTPPTLAWALLPYLALVARHLLAPPARPSAGPGPAESAEPAEPRAVAPIPPIETEAIPAPVRPAPPKPRRRPRPRTIAEPAAAWVQVGPGRFVRGEQPESTANERAEDPEPTEAAPGSEVGAALDSPGPPSSQEMGSERADPIPSVPSLP